MVLFCFNVVGQWIFFYFFFLGKCVFNMYNLLDGGVFGSVFFMIEKGYMDVVIFYMWLVNYFILNLLFFRFVVFLVDSVDVYIDLQMFEFVKENQVYIFVLLKNVIYFV